MALKSPQETILRHIWCRKTLSHNVFYDRWFSDIILYIHKLSHTPRILSLRFCTYFTARANFHPIKGKTKPNSEFFAHVSRALHQLHVITSNFDWLTALSAPSLWLFESITLILVLGHTIENCSDTFEMTIEILLLTILGEVLQQEVPLTHGSTRFGGTPTCVFVLLTYIKTILSAEVTDLHLAQRYCSICCKSNWLYYWWVEPLYDVKHLKEKCHLKD